MVVSTLWVVVGFTLLIIGANWLVNGASQLAKKYSVSDLAIGLTIVAFGTSAPELVVNSIASINGHYDIILGNIIGSNNFNLFIILGITGIISPIRVKSSTAWKEIPISLFAALLLLLFANDFVFSGNTTLSRVDGIIMLLLFLLFLYYVFKQMKAEDDLRNNSQKHKPMWQVLGLIVVGLIGLILGGKLVVDNSVNIASQMGVSKKIIGLTVVAAGTSLPELMTTIVAALKKNNDMAIGNVIGSNIFNILLILSLSSLINPVAYNPKFNLDIFISIGGTLLLLLFMVTGNNKKLDRWEAGVLLTLYLSYTFYLVWQEL